MRVGPLLAAGLLLLAPACGDDDEGANATASCDGKLVAAKADAVPPSDIRVAGRHDVASSTCRPTA